LPSIYLKTMQEIDIIIRNRRSVFPEMYEEKEIPNSLILNILENAHWAPNHKLTEPWRFKIFKGEGLNTLAEFLGEQYTENSTPENFSAMKHQKAIEKAKKCGCIIAVCIQPDPDKRLPEEEEILAVGAAIENMWLSCSAYGIGCYLSTPGAIRNIGRIVEMAEGERCVGLFYMGWKKEGELVGKRTPVGDKIVWV